jgi:hypothetical protein
MLFLITNNPEVIVVAFEVPFSFCHELNSLYRFQRDYDVGLLWELLRGFVRDKDALYWVHVHVAGVVRQSKSVHLEDFAFHS